jgi:dipeptidyl aminopeptidase/acylaminoacyl peptidase
MQECRDGNYAYGASMGAGVLLQCLAQEKRLRAVVAESPFSSFVEVARHRIRGFLWETPWAGRLLAPPVVFGGTLYARLRYGIDLAEAAPEDSVVGVTTPILLIHGDADDNIPLEHSRAIAARNPSIQLWVVPGARHTEAASAQPAEFRRRLLGWFDSH